MVLGEKEVDRAEQLRYVQFEVAALNALEVVLLDACFFLDTILGGSIKKGYGPFTTNLPLFTNPRSASSHDSNMLQPCALM